MSVGLDEMNQPFVACARLFQVVEEKTSTAVKQYNNGACVAFTNFARVPNLFTAAEGAYSKNRFNCVKSFSKTFSLSQRQVAENLRAKLNVDKLFQIGEQFP